MAIIDRVKKRVETDLDDTELQLMIDEANQDVIAKFGPHADPSNPITVHLEGRRKKIVLSRPIDITQSVVIKELFVEYGLGPTPYTIEALDYRIWPNGLVLERLITGPNAWSHWADQVEVTYVPVNDGDQREEVIIKLVILSLQYEGVSDSTVGDISENNLDYNAERGKLLNSLAPRGGLYMA